MEDTQTGRGSWSLVSRMRLALLLLFIPVLLLGALYYLHVTRLMQNELSRQLTDENRKFSAIYVEPYLEELERQFLLLYQHIDYRDFLDPRAGQLAEYYQDWQSFFNLRGDLKYVYVGTEQKRIFITPEWVPDDKFDPRLRPWYLKAVAAPDRIVWTDPYYDYISGELVMAMARALPDKSGRVRAVFAVDTVLNRLSQVLQGHSSRLDSRQMIVNPAGQLVAYPDTRLLLQPMAHPDWLGRMTQAEGQFVDNRAQLFVSYMRLSREGWTLVSVLPTAQIEQTRRSALLNVLGVVALASLFYLIVALAWSRYFRRMTDEISSVIRAARSEASDVPLEQMRELTHVYAELVAVGQDYQEARQQANLDKLTGLYNRRYFDEQLESLLESGQIFFLGMMDLDNFKQVNDTYGHQTGDVVLKRVAQTGLALFNLHGWFCRYGGEELVLILLVEEERLARGMMEDMRLEVSLLHWREAGLSVTLSGGLARVQGGSAQECLARVDAMVYASKRRGKNCISVDWEADPADQESEREALP
ncbi:sensor domain-containing diguanylate cyclase [Aeromonas schubertii]